MREIKFREIKFRAWNIQDKIREWEGMKDGH